MVDPSSSQQFGSINSVHKQECIASQMYYPPKLNQIWRQIIQLILTSPEPTTMLPRIARELGEIFQADACLIVAGTSSDATTVETSLWCDGEFINLSLDHQEQLLSHPLLADALNRFEPVATSALQANETVSAVGWPWEILPVSAMLKISTCFQGTANGMVVIAHFQPHEWSNQEKELLQLVCEPVAIALSQVEFSTQAQLSLRYQTLLKEISKVIRHTSDIDLILKTVLVKTAQTLQVDGGLLMMLKYADPLYKSRRLQTLPKAKATVVEEWSAKKESAASDTELSRLKNYSFSLSEYPFCQEALRISPRPLAIADKAADLKVPELMQPTRLNPEQMSALVMVPLMGTTSSDPEQAVVLGFLLLQQIQPRLWKPEELELLNWVSSQASTAIIHNQTLHQVQSLVEERTAQLERSLKVQAKLYEKTRQQMEQLRQLNQLKDEFLTTMSHELNTPLASMKMAIRMLRQTGLPPERQTKYLDILEQEWNREHSLIQDLLTWQQLQLESKQATIHLQKLNLKEIISELAQTFEQRWADKGLTLAVKYCTSQEGELTDSALMLDTDADSFKRILIELLTNAGKYSHPDTVVHLNATHQVNKEGNQIILTLTNIGSGISPEEQKYIFEPFRRGQGVTDKAVSGTGLGLALVKSLTQNLNGTIEVSSAMSEESQASLVCFTLTLPQFQLQH